MSAGSKRCLKFAGLVVVLLVVIAVIIVIVSATAGPRTYPKVCRSDICRDNGDDCCEKRGNQHCKIEGFSAQRGGWSMWSKCPKDMIYQCCSDGKFDAPRMPKHDPSKCREHERHRRDPDCCGGRKNTWCADGYRKQHTGKGCKYNCYPPLGRGKPRAAGGKKKFRVFHEALNAFEIEGRCSKHGMIPA